MTHHVYIIDGGPGKYDWATIFFQTREYGKERRPVVFDVTPGTDSPTEERLEVVLNLVEWEDGNGWNWNFEGQLEDGTVVTGFYSTQKRQGTMTVGKHKCCSYSRSFCQGP